MMWTEAICRSFRHSLLVLWLALLAGTAPGEIRFKHHFIDRTGPVGNSWGTNVIADDERGGKRN